MSENLLNDVDPLSEIPMESDSRPTEELQDSLSQHNGIEENSDIEVNELEYAEPLPPEKVRWFYKEGVDKRWVEFCGYDSLRIENVWRRRKSGTNEHNNLTADGHMERVVVRGGMYDVEIDNMRCVSIYWPGEEWEIMRGTWFYDGSWIPLEPDPSRAIEETHLTLFQKSSPTQSSSTSAASTPSHSYKVLHTKNFPEFHVDWHAVDDVALYSENTPSKLMRSVTLKLGFTKTTGYRLRRGYKHPAVMDDKPHDIDHLVFVVHGIGQKRDTGKIIRNTTSFRECVDWLKQKYFPTLTHRAEFFPVEWRSSLKLDGDIVDAITPYSVLSIRHLLNTSAMDILYYTSPLYGGEVRAGLQKELNRLYFMFASRHPNWKGKVSILAHSLGCVIVYDIVTGWMGPDNRPSSPASPEVSPEDPVAYRMEPLLERGYSRVEPVLIPPYGGFDGQPCEQSPSSSNAVDPNLPSAESEERDESPGDMPSRNADKGWSLWGLVRGGWSTKDGTSLSTPDMNPPFHPDQELKPRLDYVLRAVGLGRNYLYTVTAHTAYWSNYDVAYFVLTKLFPALET
ncbi:phospholipase DDHD1 isoform X3 [Neodiprion pinetum]|uniref:phospholipase DDHD1 isoform X3 n=1 Tax=Neodiprion pinetum TaxID=441929 RepID=UPI001EDE0677|nr:phospholipase DDHD1-like isoform X3 [Neodiprion pinetum]